MKLGSEFRGFTQTLKEMSLYPFHQILAGIKYFIPGDAGKIIREQENFFFTELADRSITNPQGYASTYIGLPFLRLYSFYVFTGENFVKEAASYGEYDEKNPHKFDKQARSLFEPVKEFLGDPAIVNMNGKDVAAERKGIKNNLSQARAADAAWKVFDNTFSNWPNDKSLNYIICYACTQVIARAWFNLEEVPETLIPLLKTAEYYVFNRDKVNNADFEKLRCEIKALSDGVITAQEASIQEGDSYVTFLQKHRGKQNLSDLNALAGLVVEGNITTVMTGALLQIAANSDLQKRLREEFNTLDPTTLRTEEGYRQLKVLPLLHQFYLEALRFYSPSPPMARYASKACQINGIDIPARSYLFIPLRRIMHDPAQWLSPEIFEPSRHQSNDRCLNKFPLIPFSIGPRVCPASFGFVEAMFKIGVVNLLLHHQLTLTSHEAIETIPVNAKEPRLKQTYFAKLSRLSEVQKEDPEVLHKSSKVLQLGSPLRNRKDPLSPISSARVTSTTEVVEKMIGPFHMNY